MTKKAPKGLYSKYHVNRVDGRDIRPGDKHYRCEYFALDLSHDPAARKAAIKYAGFILAEKPDLARDLITLCAKLHVADKTKK